MLIPFASVTDSLVTLATHLINDLGLAGITLLMTITGVIGVPGTEPIMLFSGFNVYQGHLSLVSVIVAGVIGDTLGASIAYAIGYYGRRELIERHGNKLHVNPGRLALAERWFEKRGVVAIFFSRWIPVARAAFPYAAGVARMPYLRFVVAAALGSVFWVTGLAVLGKEVGSDWVSWRHHLEYVDYAGLALLVVAIVYLIARRTRPVRGGPGSASGGEDPAPDAAS